MESELEKILQTENIPQGLIEDMANLMDSRMGSIFGKSSLTKDVEGKYQRGLIINGSLARYLGNDIKKYLQKKGVGYDIGVCIGKVGKKYDTVLVEDTTINFNAVNGKKYFS